MIVELLTPLMLATAPAKLIVPSPSGNYDHSAQRIITEQGSTYQTAQYGTSTFNATRTYDFNGRPNDSDHDMD